MICKHCPEQVVKNTIRSSPEPKFKHEWKHEHTHLFGCFDDNGVSLRTLAEPREG